MEAAMKGDEKPHLGECWTTAKKNPYILKLAASAGIGGLLFGYDTGVISGALLYIRDEFEDVNRKTWLQETIVSMAVAGAIIGAAFGGYLNDRLGRRKTMLGVDVLFFLGALVMALAPSPAVVILGRILVGFGVGMASMTAPLYISEASPHRVRGALVSSNGILITGGQFLSYLINLAFTKTPGTWRWMLGVAGVPAVIQFFLMLTLPESPRWLYRQNDTESARKILEKIYPEDEVHAEMEALRVSVAEEMEDRAAEGGVFSQLKGALKNKIVRRGLYAGITVQVAQQFVGINTVMYYAPTIVQFAGFASKSVALALSLVTSGLNVVGSFISMLTVDKFGRRKLMIISMIGIIVLLVSLSGVFTVSSMKSPRVSLSDSTNFGVNATCPAYLKGADSSWDCMSCLDRKCAFCANGDGEYDPGACIESTKMVKSKCKEAHRVVFEKGCPSRYGLIAVVLLGLYIISYAPGMGTVPWIVNSEIYPLRYRGIGGGIAAVCNWMSNLIVSETYLSLTEALGAGGTFLLFAGMSCIGLLFILWVVPETKGLQFEQVEKVLEEYDYRTSCLSRNKVPTTTHNNNDSQI